MYHSDEVIRQLQDQKILANKLDSAISGVYDLVTDQINKIEKGATRLSFYSSCFTEEYFDVCRKQAAEDNRFMRGVIQLVKNRSIISDLIQPWVDYQLQNRTPRQLEAIKILLMRASVHITASTLTTRAFSVGVTMYIVMGMNIKLPIGRAIGTTIGGAVGGMNIYGIVQNAADSASRLQIMHPPYYQALYMRELEMMYFLVEDRFMQAGVLVNKWMSDFEVANAILKLMRKV